MAARSADQQQQWQRREDDEQHKREIVVIRDHRRLAGDFVIERGDPRRVGQAERRGQVRRLGQGYPSANARLGANARSVCLAELGFEDRDADAAAEHTHQRAQCRSLSEDMVRQA